MKSLGIYWQGRIHDLKLGGGDLQPAWGGGGYDY